MTLPFENDTGPVIKKIWRHEVFRQISGATCL